MNRMTVDLSDRGGKWRDDDPVPFRNGIYPV
jgi:hypothetical protein